MNGLPFTTQGKNRNLMVSYVNMTDAELVDPIRRNVTKTLNELSSILTKNIPLMRESELKSFFLMAQASFALKL